MEATLQSTGNATYALNRIMQTAGSIAAASTNNGLTTNGQSGETGGQKLSNAGQPGSTAGQVFAPQWPKKHSGRLLSVSKQTLLSELQEAVDVWEELPQPLKDGILAIVRGQAK